MKLWLATFKGAYLGGVAVVFAESRDIARRVIRRKVSEKQDDDRVLWHLQISEVEPPDAGAADVVYLFDGDY